MFLYLKTILSTTSLENWINLVLGCTIGELVYLVYCEGRLIKPVYKRRIEIISVVIVVWSTLLLRTAGAEHQANLTPLWSWQQAFILGKNDIRWQIYFNILLFMPVGFFAYRRETGVMWHIFMRGLLLSLFVEVCQYIFCLGLFEYDDLLHNTLGCMLGGYCSKLFGRVRNILRLHKVVGRKQKE